MRIGYLCRYSENEIALPEAGFGSIQLLIWPGDLDPTVTKADDTSAPETSMPIASRSPRSAVM